MLTTLTYIQYLYSLKSLEIENWNLYKEIQMNLISDRLRVNSWVELARLIKLLQLIEDKFQF